MKEANSGDASTTPCISINGTPLDWSGRLSSHVDFHKDEILPLLQGRFLGYGIHGGVYETTCNGVQLAWKRKFCRYRIGDRERREIEIIKRLDHRHIIQLVGTYTHGPFLGLLMWPVATCDLATFIEDLDWFRRMDGAELNKDLHAGFFSVADSSDEGSMRAARLVALGIYSHLTVAEVIRMTAARLEHALGCMASAIAYLHYSGIKHKDLKPSNVLLSHNGLWVTDFGTATDFSILSRSTTESGERGTPKYFAPEVAAFAPSGRSADIFSLGCIFLEIFTLCIGYSLEETQRLRVHHDKSFQSNLDRILEWFNFGRISQREPSDSHLLGLVRCMIDRNPANRPTAQLVEEKLELIGGLCNTAESAPFFGSCCSTPMLAEQPAQAILPPDHSLLKREMTISIGNTYLIRPPRLNTYVFFIIQSIPDIIAEVHIFLFNG
ncbi:kinase-like protein [Zopfia rhizophila CBS 207.26]|uniref:Kinase-like protein n=1 Tax=Zopfia rhizophila CBS 207.26 TaxID=1314779 RepID=A0A6A6EC83_9PEZI|nr:kinase-like protein [Zopfia rhizophila CBS 207.26]